MPRLIRVFTGCKSHFVGFVMRRLKCLIHVRYLLDILYVTDLNVQKDFNLFLSQYIIMLSVMVMGYFKHLKKDPVYL